MSLAEPLKPAALETDELAEALVDLSRRLASMESEWLSVLAEFDRREGWRRDGQLSCTDWLVWRCGLSARTARDKLRVAHELQRRPAVAAAFADGWLSYTKVRAITRITRADPDTDEWLLKVASNGTAADLERLARYWRLLQEQEKGVDDYLRRFDRRAVRASQTYDGMMIIETIVPVEEGKAALAALDAATGAQAVTNGSAEPSSTAQLRADAFLELFRAGAEHIDAPSDTSGADRYTVHVVTDLDGLQRLAGGRAELLDGTAISLETVRRLSCDAGIVRHLVKGKSAPIDIGRRTSVWPASMRRAIGVRDRGHCRWPGCWRRTCDAHHVIHWGDSGPTTVSNGCLLCPQHHTCVHERGFRITGEPNGELRFYVRTVSSWARRRPLGPNETERRSARRRRRIYGHDPTCGIREDFGGCDQAGRRRHSSYPRRHSVHDQASRGANDVDPGDFDHVLYAHDVVIVLLAAGAGLDHPGLFRLLGRPPTGRRIHDLRDTDTECRLRHCRWWWSLRYPPA